MLVSACKHDNDPTSDNEPISPSGYATPESYPGMKLVWRDEFEGNQLNLSDWKYEMGGHGWGNQELEYYTKRYKIKYVEYNSG